MAFGRRLPEAQPTNRGRYGLSFWGLTVALFALLLAGCGGGSSDNNNGGSNVNNPTITGRVVDQYSSFAPVVGVTVTVRNSGGSVVGTTTTNSTGNFSIQIKPTNNTSTVSFTAPSGVSLYSTGYINSQGFNINNGTSIPALASSQTYAIGDVVVLSESGGPPPPPF